MILYGREYPFGQFGSDVLAVLPPSFFATAASSLAGQCEKKNKKKNGKGLKTVQALLSKN